VEVFGSRVPVPRPDRTFGEGEKVTLVVRPEGISLDPAKGGGLHGKVYESVYLGNQISYGIEVEGIHLSAEIANPQERRLFHPGDMVSLNFHPGSLHILPFEQEE
jgi:ABC-type Fe3+/spermidine/putrescine transport system ATPase subunit